MSDSVRPTKRPTPLRKGSVLDCLIVTRTRDITEAEVHRGVVGVVVCHCYFSRSQETKETGAVPIIFLSAATVATAEVADCESAPSSSSRKRPAAAESSFRKRTAAELPETVTNKRSAVEREHGYGKHL